MDDLEFKIQAAQRFLLKIPDTIPDKPEFLEENAEAFLFFAAGAIEVLKRQINDKFGIFDKENVFYIYGLKKALSDYGEQKKVKDAISHYFTTPKRSLPRIDTSKSGLWRLQALRNQSMHGSIIKRHGKSLLFLYTIHEASQTWQFTQRTANPRRYFGQIMENMTRFAAQIRLSLGNSA